MIQITVKEIRPNTLVNFFEGVQDSLIDQFVRDYFFENYIETGKLIATEKNLSEDGLILTKTMIWNSEQDRLDFVKDAYLKENLSLKRDQYNYQNNITKMAVSIEQI